MSASSLPQIDSFCGVGFGFTGRFALNGHTHCGLDGACLTEDRLALLGSIGIRNGRLVFFPWRLRAHSSRNKKASAHGRPPLRFGLSGAGRSSPV
jgi:hypothetical protein